MREENKALLIKYIVCFGVASLITLVVFWIKGFFTDDVVTNVLILCDGFTTSGLMLTLFAGILFVSGEGALLGIGFVLKNVVQAFVPMGRKYHEKYADYRARKLGSINKSGDHCILHVGLLFFAVGVIFSLIWYANFYNMAG